MVVLPVPWNVKLPPPTEEEYDDSNAAGIVTLLLLPLISVHVDPDPG